MSEGIEVKVGVGGKVILGVAIAGLLGFFGWQYFGSNRSNSKFSSENSEVSISSSQYPAGGTHSAANITQQNQTPQTNLPASYPTATSEDSGYWIQVGAFLDSAGAERMRENIREKTGYPSEIFEANVKGNHYYRVRIGAFVNQSEANAELSLFKEKGLEGYVVKQK